MKLMVTGGGTGGHVYPALAVVETLCRDARWNTRWQDIAWVGSAASIEERIMAQEGVAFYAISTGAVLGRNPVAALRSLRWIARGYAEARQLLARWRPEVILATGGYVSVPLVLAAKGARVPVLIYLPDMRPGLAVRFLARYAERVAVSFPSVARYFPAKKVLVSGYPARAALFERSKAQAREALGLSATRPVLLVFGGSRGAHALNEAVRRHLVPLLETAQVVHISGEQDYAALEDVRQGLPEELRRDYHLFSFLYGQMVDALAAADLVVARAGAGTLGEFPAVGLPAVLVPYPYAGQHQQLNADYLAAHGAAVIVQDRELGERFWPTVRELLGDPARLQAMSAAARALAVPEAAGRIAAALAALARPN